MVVFARNSQASRTFLAFAAFLKVFLLPLHSCETLFDQPLRLRFGCLVDDLPIMTAPASNRGLFQQLLAKLIITQIPRPLDPKELFLQFLLPPLFHGAGKGSPSSLTVLGNAPLCQQPLAPAASLADARAPPNTVGNCSTQNPTEPLRASRVCPAPD